MNLDLLTSIQEFAVSLQVVNLTWCMNIQKTRFEYTKKDLNSNSNLNQVTLYITL
jgi:hypothetical protein